MIKIQSVFSKQRIQYPINDHLLFKKKKKKRKEIGNTVPQNEKEQIKRKYSEFKYTTSYI